MASGKVVEKFKLFLLSSICNNFYDDDNFMVNLVNELGGGKRENKKTFLEIYTKVVERDRDERTQEYNIHNNFQKIKEKS